MDTLDQINSDGLSDKEINALLTWLEEIDKVIEDDKESGEFYREHLYLLRTSREKLKRTNRSSIPIIEPKYANSRRGRVKRITAGTKLHKEIAEIINSFADFTLEELKLISDNNKRSLRLLKKFLEVDKLDPLTEINGISIIKRIALIESISDKIVKNLEKYEE